MESTERILALRPDIDDVLRSFLAERRRTVESIDAAATPLVDEIVALIDSGGKRLRPLFCVCGFRATGAEIATPILKAAAAMELLHSMALIHDDVMDASLERRERPTVEARQAALARARGIARPEHVGRSVAILAGDLAAVLADDLMLTAGFAAERLAAALERYHAMRLEMAAGQFLDVSDAGAASGGGVRSPRADRRAAALRGGSYTVRGPLLVGAAFAGASDDVVGALERYAEPLGEAFQLADDIADGDAPPGRGPDVGELVARARAALERATVHPDALDALMVLAERVQASAERPRPGQRHEQRDAPPPDDSNRPVDPAHRPAVGPVGP
jgi:geranylgeranyl diphosphate synthase type I